MNDQLIHGSLFSGVGGFELGAQLQGVKTAFSCEIVEYNQQILKQHFPDTKIYTDVTKFNGSSYNKKVNIISGGFPCQDISVSNTKKPQGVLGKRSGLWSEMFRIIREIRPEYVIIENSPALTYRGLEYVLCDLSKIRYNAEWQCISGYPFGLAHKRERIYIIAYTTKRRCGMGSNEKGIFREILPRETPRQGFIPNVTQRVNKSTDFKALRVSNDVPKGLDKKRIEAMGNAVMPVVASYLFKCIKMHYYNL